jgi:hypothetical protein
VLASLAHKQLVRDNYVDLHGVDCTWRKVNETGSAKANIYGEIKSTGLTFTDTTVKVVMDLSKHMEMLTLKSAELGDERMMGRINGIVKLSLIINVGDRIVLPTKYQNLTIENKVLQVVEVPAVHHYGAVSKSIVMVPLRDA